MPGAALADELHCVGERGERLVETFDALVHLAKQRFVQHDSALAVVHGGESSLERFRTGRRGKGAGVASRDERVAANEAIFRSANERIRDKAIDVDQAFGFLPFICECADSGCTDLLQMTLGEYEHVRADPHTFTIARGHAAGESERVIGGDDRFEVVENLPPGQELTERTDPRR
jgi:hypothetical protein